jgi:diguanylate cyclase (GGDEF)-like protein
MSQENYGRRNAWPQRPQALASLTARRGRWFSWGRAQARWAACAVQAAQTALAAQQAACASGDALPQPIRPPRLLPHGDGTCLSAETSGSWQRTPAGALETVFMPGALPGLAQLGHADPALIDRLTGQLNAGGIECALQAAVSGNSGIRALALMRIDLDGFSTVNDALGYAAGSALLAAVADRLDAVLQGRGVLGRYSGDEFVILSAHECSAQRCAALPQALLRALREPFTIGGDEIHVSASIGVSEYPMHGAHADELLSTAASALRYVKKRGGGAAKYFDLEMAAAAKAQCMMERFLRKALARGEFVLEYQPRVALVSMRVVAMEALIRWDHPVLGRVQPNEFIAIAEQKGLIVEIGQWVLLTACAFARDLQASMPEPLRVSVNLSAHQLKCPDIYEQVCQALALTGLPPDLLELEVTESALIEDFERSACTLHRLKTLGIHLSVDDFGTGYSSLAYLQSFPFDAVKLDKTFVNRKAAGADNSRFIKALIDLSHTLDLAVVAEGVETPAVLDFLVAARCDEVQGYLFSRPLSAAKLKALVIGF